MSAHGSSVQASSSSSGGGNGILFPNTVFPKNAHCIDFLSFDPGYVNAGVCHLRFDTVAKKFCIVHAALIDVLKPNECFTRKQQKNKRARFTERVQPFCQFYPSFEKIDYQFDVTETHRARVAAIVAKKTDQDAKSDEVLFADYVALLPFTLQSVSWLNGSEPIDQVLLEVQDPNNPKMRSVAHSIQSFYETKNATQDRKQVPIEFVSSRLKLSTAVLTTLADQLMFESGKPATEQSLVALVDSTSQPTRKQSAVRIFDALASAATSQHQFFKWYSEQRSTKHNIIDSILQCLSYCLEKDIGFEPGLLNGKRKAAASQRAKELRQLKKQEKQAAANDSSMLDLTEASEINPLVETVSDTSAEAKRRKVVPIDL